MKEAGHMAEKPRATVAEVQQAVCGGDDVHRADKEGRPQAGHLHQTAESDTATRPLHVEEVLHGQREGEGEQGLADGEHYKEGTQTLAGPVPENGEKMIKKGRSFKL